MNVIRMSAMGDTQDLTEVRVLICRKLKLYGCVPVSHIFLQSENEKKMEVAKRICQTEEVKGSRVLFGVVLLRGCCDYL